MDCIIDVKVRGNHLSKDNRNAGVQYEANVTHLRIDFDEGWDGYAKTVTFWNALMGSPVKWDLTTDKLVDIEASTRIYQIPIPGEAMTESGDLTFVIDGYTVEPFGENEPYLGVMVQIEGEPEKVVVVPMTNRADALKLPGRRVSIGGDIYTVKDVEFSTADAEAPVLILSDAVKEAEIGTVIYPADGKRKRSLSDTLWVKPAPYEEEASEPTAPTPTHMEQMQVQVDQIKDTIQEAATAVSDAFGYAEFARGQADNARDAALYAQTWANEAADARTGAEAARDEAAQSAEDAKHALSGGVVTEQLGAHNTSSTAHADIREELAAVARAKTGGEIDQRLQNRIEKTGDSMTGILTFDTPGLFSAIQKKRTISGTNYIMKLGVGNYGTGGNVSLRLATVAADGTETIVSQFDMDETGLVWVSPGGVRKTVAHSGNIGVLTASVE